MTKLSPRSGRSVHRIAAPLVKTHARVLFGRARVSLNRRTLMDDMTGRPPGVDALFARANSARAKFTPRSPARTVILVVVVVIVAILAGLGLKQCAGKAGAGRGRRIASARDRPGSPRRPPPRSGSRCGRASGGRIWRARNLPWRTGRPRWAGGQSCRPSRSCGWRNEAAPEQDASVAFNEVRHDWMHFAPRSRGKFGHCVASLKRNGR